MNKKDRIEFLRKKMVDAAYEGDNNGMINHGLQSMIEDHVDLEERIDVLEKYILSKIKREMPI